MEWIPDLADATRQLARCQLCASEFEFDVQHSADVKNQATEFLLRLKTAGADTIELDDGFPDMMVSLIEGGEKIIDDHDGNSDLSCICQQGYDTVEPVNRASLEVAVPTHTTTMQKEAENNSTLEESRQEQASDRKF